MTYLEIAVEKIFKPLQKATSQEDVTKIIIENRDAIVEVYDEMVKENIVHDWGYKLFIENEKKNWKPEALETDESTFEFAIRTLMFTFLKSWQEPALIFDAKFCPMVRFAYETYIKINNK